MRPLEILLLLADFSVLALMFLPLPLRVYGSRVLPIVAVLIAATQLSIEGPRWQMAPAYLMVGLLFPILGSRKIFAWLGGLALSSR